MKQDKINYFIKKQHSLWKFGSIGKGSIMTGKAENICQKHPFLGGRGGERHSPALTGKFRSYVLWNVIPSFWDLCYANWLLFSLNNNLKCFISIISLCLECSLFKVHSMAHKNRKAVYTLVLFHTFIHFLDWIRSQLAYFLKLLV